MDITTVLSNLGFMDQAVFPASDLSSYQTMVSGWRHPNKQPPSEADMIAESVNVEITINAHEEIQRLEALETPRRLAEAFADPTWLNSNRDLIAIERAKL